MDNMLIMLSLNRVASLSILLPFIIFLFRGRYAASWQRIFSIYLGFSLLFELVMVGLAYDGIRNIILVHFFTPVEFCLLVLSIGHTFKGIISPKWQLVFIVVFSLFSIGNSIWLQPLDQLNTNSINLSEVVLIALSLKYYYLILKKLHIPKLIKESSFWFVSGTLFIEAINILLFVSFNLLDEGDPNTFLLLFTVINSPSLILRNLAYSYSCWLMKKPNA